MRCKLRQPEPEPRPAFRKGFTADFSAPTFYRQPAEIQPQPRFASTLFSSRKERENLAWGHIRRKPWAFVIHICPHKIAVLGDIYSNPGIGRRITQRILQ